MDLGSFLDDISVDISARLVGFVCFFAFFSQATFITDFVSDISVIYRYIDDILPILGNVFRFFQQTTFVCQIVSGRPDTRNIDDIS